MKEQQTMTDTKIVPSDTAVVRKNLELGLELGSLKSLVKETAEVVMLLIDTSYSMAGYYDDGKSPIDQLRDAVKEINPRANSIPMIAFGGPYDAQVRFVDAVPDAAGGTPLHIAIPYAKEYGATRVVVISDGCPDLHEQSLKEAKAFGGQIDIIYIGEADDSGSQFLEKLAALTGGSRLQGNILEPKQLGAMAIGLLEGEVEKKVTLQGPGFTTVDQDEEVEEDDEGDDD